MCKLSCIVGLLVLFVGCSPKECDDLDLTGSGIEPDWIATQLSSSEADDMASRRLDADEGPDFAEVKDLGDSYFWYMSTDSLRKRTGIAIVSGYNVVHDYVVAQSE